MTRSAKRPLLLALLALLAGLAGVVFAASPATSPAQAQDGAQPTAQPPAKPAGLTVDASAGSLAVSVDWDDVAGADDYLVRWRLQGPGQDLNEGLRPASSQTQITVASQGKWVVRVQACQDGVCGAAAALQFTVEPAPEPEPAPAPEPLSVAVAASATTVPVGEAVNLSAAITGAPAGSPTYRWEISHGSGAWVAISAQAAPAYAASSAETTSFRVSVSYGSGESATSDPVTVSFEAPAPLSVAVAASATTVPVGEAVSLSAEITGAPAGTPTYHWELSYGGGSWFALSAQATASYLTSSPETAHFRVSVSYGSGESATSEPVTVSFAEPAPEPLSVAVSPSATTVPVGEAVSLSAEITGAPAGTPTYHWELSYGGGSWFALSAQATASYLTSSPETAHFRVSVSYGSGESATSDPLAVSFAAPRPPAGPTGLEAATAEGSLEVSLDWDDVAGADDYLVRWRLQGPGQDLNDGLRSTSSEAAITVADGGLWVASVQACNSAGCGAATAVRFEVAGPPPEAPQNLELTAAPIPEQFSGARSATRSPGSGTPALFTLTASWDAVEGATFYRVSWRRVDGGGPGGRSAPAGGQLEVRSPGATIPVAGAGEWELWVQACNDAGCSAPALKRVQGRGGPVQGQSGHSAADLDLTLISNEAQPGGTGRSIQAATFDLAQAFTTGPHAGGYRLTGVGFAFAGVGTTVPSFTMKVCTGSDSEPCATKTGDLTVPTISTDAGSGGDYTATAAGHGLDLAASTTYYVVFTLTAAGTGNSQLVDINTSHEDTDRAVGWGIADGVLLKSHTAGSSWIAQTDSLQITVVGRAKESTPPTPQRYEISGSKLIITYDRPLDTTAPAAGQFRVKVGSAATADASAVAISGNRVTLTTASAAASGDTVQTRYIKPNSGNKLKDIDGNEVADQTSMQAVTNHTGDTTPSLESAVVDGGLFTLTFDRSLNEAVVPAESAIRYHPGDAWRTVNTASVVVSGNQITFNALPASVPRLDQTVQFRYSKPATNKLQDAWGNEVASTGSQTATNNSPLVKNTGQTPRAGSVNANADITDRDQAQPFTTGTNAGGYTLSSVEVMLTGWSGTAVPTYTVAIHAANAGGQPTGAALFTLTKPAALKRGLNRFTAPASGIDLDANTRYVLVIDITSNVNDRFAFFPTAEDGEDAGKAPGWSIAAGRYTRPLGGGSWSATNTSLRMVLRGTINPLSDVANTGQTESTGALTIGTAGAKDWSHALAFTTGSDPTTLTEVDARLKTVPTTAGVQVSVWSTTGANKLPDSKLYTLTNPTLAADSLNTFTAPAGSTLDASTTYAVVFENTAPANQYELAKTESNDEDAGATSGWSIADKGAHKGGTDDWAVNSGADKAQIAVRVVTGTPPAAPTGLAATPGDQQLSLSWTDPSDSSITKYQYRLSTDGGTTWSPDWTDVSGSGATTTSHSVTGLNDGTTYTVEVRAVGDSDLPSQAARTSATTTGAATLVANTGAADASGTIQVGVFSLVERPKALAFTTGSDPAILAEVDAKLASVPSTAGVQVSVWSTASGLPSAKLYSLTNPSTITENSVNTFTAPAGSVLKAGTTYAVVFENTVNGTVNAYNLKPTTSNDEDAGAESGWSIADHGAKKEGISGWSAESGASKAKIAIKGVVDGTAPRLLGVVVDGTTITLTYDEPLDDGSTPATTAFSVTVDGTTRPVSSVMVSGSVVTLALSGAAVSSSKVAVSYTVPTGATAKPIRDVAQNNAILITSATARHIAAAVSNTGRRRDVALAVGKFGPFQISRAVAFSTGARSIPLTGVEAKLAGVATGAGVVVSVWSTSAAGLPQAKLYTLTNPATITADSVTTFTAPANTTLAADTTYAVVFENTSTGANDRYFLAMTDSLAEDAGAAAGWSIADNHAERSADGDSWTGGHTYLPQVAIMGPDIAPPGLVSAVVDGNTLTLTYDEVLGTLSTPASSAFTVTVAGTARTVTSVAGAAGGSTVTLDFDGAAVTSSQRVTVRYDVPTANRIQDPSSNDAAALSFLLARHIAAAVSNTGQPQGDAAAVGAVAAARISVAAAFTTGARSIALSGVEAQLGSVQTGAGVVVGVWSTSAAGLPQAKLYTLTNPTITANSLNTFSAPAGGAVLEADTTYAVVFENSSTADSTVYQVAATNSAAEDARAAPGWSIADRRPTRVAAGGGWAFLQGSSDQPLQVAILGADIAPPVVTRAEVEGAELTLTYSEPLAPASTLATSAFMVTVNGAGRPVSQAALAGSEVTLTLGSPVLPGQAVTLSYTLPQSNPVEDPSGNDAANLASRAVSVVTTAVANTGQTAASGAFTIGTAGAHHWAMALAFTTGPDALTLTGVEAKLGDVPDGAGVQVKILWVGANGLPSTERVALTNPDTITPNGLNTFTASEPVALLPNRTYAVVFRNTATGAANAYQLARTVSNAEDAGAAVGWSLADQGHNQQGTNAWAENSGANKAQIAVKGAIIDTTAPVLSRATLKGTELRLVYNEALDSNSTPGHSAFSVTAPGNPTVSSVAVNGPVVTLTLSSAVTAGPVTVSYTRGTNPVQDWTGNDAANLSSRAVDLVVELVANTDPGNFSGIGLGKDVAQAFTTGSSAAGYVLTEVQLDFWAVPGDARHSLTIQGATTSSGPDGTILGALTAPSSISAGLQTYTAAGTGIALEADTSYFVVLDAQEPKPVVLLATVAADGEDSGAAPGWSIGNTRFDRTWDSSGAWAADSVGRSAQIAVHGRANDTAPPTLTRATVEGKQLVLSYNEALDEDSEPAGSAYTVTVAGATRTVTAVAVAGAVVTLTLSGADVAVGQAVTLSYTAPSANPIQDQAGNDAAALSGRAVALLVTAVANTGQTAVAGAGLDVGKSGAHEWSMALAFTTGASAVTLSELQASLKTVPEGAGVQVSVWNATAAGVPSGSDPLYTLANPVVIASDSLNTFTAPAGATLDASTTYAVVFSNTSGDAAHLFQVARTVSTGEDSGAESGWSIADKGAFQQGTSAWAANSGANKAQIAIRVTTAPTLTAAVVQGRTLTLTYDKALDSGSRPATGAFTVTVAGQSRTVTNVVLNGSEVRLTISGAQVTGGQAVTLSYTVPAANPIQDSAGNHALGISSRAVTVHGITALEFTGQPTGNYASIGGHVEITVSFSQAATVTGTPRIRLSGFSGQTRYAGYVSGSGSKQLVFRYTLKDGDSSGTAHVSAARNGLQLSGGTIRFGATNAPIGHISVDSGKRAKVAQPAVELAYAVSPSADHDLDGANDTYVAGNTIKVKLRFSEPMTVDNGGANSNIRIVITIGSTDHTLNYISASGSDLEFGSRTVAANDSDLDGVTIKRDGSNHLVRLSGGATIRSTANSNDAVLTASADLGVRVSADADAKTLARVQAANTAPTGHDFTTRTSPNTDLTFALRDFRITDPEDNGLKLIQVLTLPVDGEDEPAGTLALDGTEIASSALPQTVTRAQLDAGELVYTPLEDFTGRVTFTFKVVDAFGDTAAEANTATISVAHPPPSSSGGGGGGGGAPAAAVPSDADFDWNVTRDIDDLARGNDAPTDLWSDGASLYVLNNAGAGADSVFVYGFDAEEDDEPVVIALVPGNRFAHGIWSDGETLLIADAGRDRLFAYNLDSGERDESREFELHEDNRDPRGIWSNGAALYVLDAGARELFCYSMNPGELLARSALDPLNQSPRGIWSDGVTIWVSDDGAKRVFAYRFEPGDDGEPDLVRVAEEEFSFRSLLKAGNSNPRGIWSDGDVLWIADHEDRKVYSYNLPDAAVTLLDGLELSGLTLGEFSALRTEYAATAAAGVRTTTVAATPRNAGASLALTPADADGDPANGHQVDLAEQTEIAVTVTSEDGRRSRTYLVRVTLAVAGDEPEREPAAEQPTGAAPTEEAPVEQPEADAAADAAVELRVAARRLSDGRIEFALQSRPEDGDWSERQLPRARFLPVDPPAERWLSSSPLTLDTAGGQIELRISARRLVSGSTEFAVQQRAADGSWSEPQVPRGRFLPADAEDGRWLVSSALTAGAQRPATQPGEQPEANDDAAELAAVLRIVVRRLEDGRLEFALQSRPEDGGWSERLLPRARFLPADPPAERWLSSSPLTLNTAGGQIELRISARRLVNGNTEFAVQQHAADGSWSERQLPRGRFLPAAAEAGRWFVSSTLDTPLEPEP